MVGYKIIINVVYEKNVVFIKSPVLKFFIINLIKVDLPLPLSARKIKEGECSFKTNLFIPIENSTYYKNEIC
jgi:hypothetical protein